MIAPALLAVQARAMTALPGGHTARQCSQYTRENEWMKRPLAAPSAPRLAWVACHFTPPVFTVYQRIRKHNE